MRRKKKLLSLLLAALVLMLHPMPVVTAGTDTLNADTTLAPYFVVEGGDTSFDRFPLKGTDVTANINGVIAEIFVVQTYANEGNEPINAGYIFPASTKVAVHGMTMQIGDKLVTAKLKEREEARAEFEAAQDEGKSASLLEQQRPNVFSMNVANIMPGDEVRIELHYTELLVPTNGIYQFVFPTVVGPRYSSTAAADAPQTDQWVASPYLREGVTPPGKYNITVNLSTGVPITDLNCTSHKVDITKSGEASAHIALANPEDYAGNRDYILEYKLTGREITTGLMLHEGEEENFFMLMLQPPERVMPEHIPPREYIFVLDVSGSMNGFPLDTAKMLMRDLLTNLKDTELFNLVLFSGPSDLMSYESVPATRNNIANAIAMFDEVEGWGGTELTWALETATSVPVKEGFSRSVVVITDGYISAEKEAIELINRRIHNTSFFSFGIGSSVNRFLIDGVAKAGLGESFVVTDPSRASAVAERFREYIQSPVLTDVKVRFTDFEAYDLEPRALPTLFAQRPIILFGKWRGEPSGTVHVTGKTGGREYALDIPISDIAPLETNSAISYLWARSRVERVMDHGFGYSITDAKKQEVIGLGLKYSILTPYTSFIAVIEMIRNPGGESTNANQPLPLPLGVSNFAVGGYAVGSEPETILFASLLVATLMISALYGMIEKKARCKRKWHPR